MSLFNRMKDCILADLHEVIDEKEKKNPIGVLNEHLRKCELEVEKVCKLVERQYALKEQFSREYSQACHLAEKRKHQAEIALTAGESQLHEFALQEQAQFEERSVHVKKALDNADQQLVELEQKYEEMKHKLKDMNLKRMELMGRENMARANYRMNQVLDTDSTYANSAAASFSNMESYLERLEQKVNSNYYRNTIDSRIAQLEKEIKNKESHSLS